MTSQPVKTCTGCGLIKPATPEFFYRQKWGLLGLESHCKVCRAAQSAARHKATHVPKPIPTQKKCKRCGDVKPIDDFSRYGGPGRFALFCNACNLLNKRERSALQPVETRRAACRKYKANMTREQKDRRNKKMAEARKSDPERFRGYARRSYVNNYDKILHRNRVRKAIRRGAPGKYTAEQVAQKLAFQGGRCYYCRCELGAVFHRDHKIPIDLGGPNWIANIALSCPDCNWKKNAMAFQEFIRLLRP